MNRIPLSAALGLLVACICPTPLLAEEEIRGEIAFPEEWTVFASFAREDPVPPPDILGSIPERLRLGETEIHATTVSPSRGQFNFRPMLGTLEPVGRTVYVFLALESPAAREVTLGMGADWWMQAWLNGEEILDTTGDGNVVWPPSIRDFRVTAPVRKGANILAVRFVSGSGSSILALGGPTELRGENPPSIAHDVPDDPPPAAAEDETFSDVRHVAVDGFDEASGTPDAPWATLQHAVDRADPGAVIRLGPGVFREQVVIRRSGTAEAPITIEGSRGPGGERLSRIDAGAPVDPSGWEPAPDIGPNVYQHANLPFEPQILTVSGRFLSHAHRVKDGSQFPYARPLEIMAWSEDHAVRTLYVSRSTDIRIPFWETVGGLYVHHPDESRRITYLRLAESADPHDPRLRDDISISDGGAVVTVTHASHVVLRGLEVAHGNIGILVQGEDSRHNRIEDCMVMHGRKRIDITARASHTTVRNCHLVMGYYGPRPGAWAGGTTPDAAVKDFLYNFFKYAHGRGSTSDDRAVHVRGSARDTIIEDSHLDGGLIGVGSASNRGLIVRRNVIHDFSSVGLVIGSGTVDAQYHDNRVYNCSIHVRLHDMNNPTGGHLAHIYRNRFFHWGPVGNHTFVHARPDIEEHPQPEVVFYHNTFVGGGRIFNHNHLLGPTPRIRFINNAAATDLRPFSGRRDDIEDPDALGPFEYNWMGGGVDAEALPAWFGETSIAEPGAQPWADRSQLPDFRLPAGHPARASGVDLSRPFRIGDTLHPPLPGMEPGYFPGPRPDRGAVQHFDP